MLLIQQSSSFRAWTSRALMVYFRRALLFLVVDPRQNLQQNYSLSSSPTIDLDDLENDETMWTMNDGKISIDLSNRKESSLKQIQLRDCLSRERLFRRLSQGLNNSMTKSMSKEPQNSLFLESIEEFSSKDLLTSTASTTDQLSHLFNKPQEVRMTEQIEVFSNIHWNEARGLSTNKVVDDTSTSKTRVPTYPHIRNQNDALSPHIHCMNSTPSVYSSSSHCSSSVSTCNSSDDEEGGNDIYEKYQTSFSHFLHRTKSLRTISNEDKLQSMLVLEPNTSIITICQLTYHPFGRNPIIHPMTSAVCLRLIAGRIDSSIQCDAIPVGCRKPSNKKLQATSVLVDLPHKTLYID